MRSRQANESQLHMIHFPIDISPDSLFSPEEFRRACLTLTELYCRSGTEARWTNTKDSGYLLLQKTLIAGQSECIRIDYHIILSPTWQVPVLYFAPIWTESLEPLTLREVYTLVVEKSSKDALEDVGILGGISHGDHPLLGIPYYFIHPCRTAELLKDIQEDNKEISQDVLLQLWLGLVGGVVNIPALPST